MKYLTHVVLLALCFSAIASAQVIPNAGFESWFAGSPTGWYAPNVEGFDALVTQVADARSGSSAAYAKVINVSGYAVPPELVAGEGGDGFPINQRPSALHGWYKFNPDSGDGFYIIVAIWQHDSCLGGAFFFSDTPRTVYTEFVVNIPPDPPGIPDSATMLFTITNGTSQYHLGSSFTIDDLSFGAPLAVEESGTLQPRQFALEQNFPNPFNPSTKIQFQIPSREFVVLKVYNLLGQEVATLVNEELNPGNYRAEFNAQGLPSGFYLYRLQSGSYTSVKKMLLMK